jgi:pSer/pThr/pTyr-binding forkhead associated (FHA) protein
VTEEGPAGVLEITAGPARGTRLSSEEPLEIGRSASGQGTLGGDPELSRRHARLERLSDGRLLLEDLGSTNGTFVNGTAIAAPTLLGPGDEVALGGTTLKVVIPSPEAPPPPRQERPRPERRPALRVVAGFAPGALIGLGREALTIGRTGVAAKALGGDPEVAEEHVRIQVTGDGRLLVEDLGSPAGTMLGETPIRAPTLVAKGERLRLGGTTLEVVEAASSAAAEAERVSRVLGGVRAVPEGLFARIGARAPVTVRDVVPVFLLSLGWAWAVNLLVKNFSVEVLDVPEDLHALDLWLLLIATFFPVAGNSFGFFMSFRRPDDRSMVRYLIPTVCINLFFLVLAVVQLNYHGFAEVVTTIALVMLPVFIVVPLMFRLRARVARERVSAVRGG